MVKTGLYVLVGIVLLAGMCSAQERSLIIRVTNPSDVPRESATISVPWDSITAILTGIRPEFLDVKESGKDAGLRYQLFSKSPGNASDCLIFQSDFKPHETKTFTISPTNNQPQSFASLVDARYVEPREDLAWENDRIAFRMYGPALAAEVKNGIDVWTKRVRYLIVKKWYQGEEQTPKIVYHEDHGEGADFFSVGKSLGCGGSGIWFRGALYQPGVFSSYKILSTGPIRTCFELQYDKWDVNGKKFAETVRITLDAGQNLNHIEVAFTPTDIPELSSIVCGLVKRPNTQWFRDEQYHWMSLWGLTTDSLVNGYLGTGVVISPEQISGWNADTAQYLAYGQLGEQKQFSYYAGAGWTRSDDFKSVDDWNDYLGRFAKNLQHPLQITLLRGDKSK